MGATAEMLAKYQESIRELEPWAVDLVRAIGTPLAWTVHRDPVLHYRKIADTLMVVLSARREADGRRWLHVSFSRPSKLPSWDDLREVKNTFVGKDRRAIQVLPPESEYVNIHDYCLHLWCCLDGDPLPDFRYEGQL
jgi:hypothetical protein